MEEQLMGMSYAATGAATSWDPNWKFQSVGSSGLTIDEAKLAAVVDSTTAPITKTIVQQPASIVASQAKRRIMTKLIRFTVVDPEPILARERPELCILLEGRRMLDGTDDKGFLMDLAPEVAKKLDAHNTEREKVEYDDDEGNSRKLKTVRLGQLDVVVEVLKEYAE